MSDRLVRDHIAEVYAPDIDPVPFLAKVFVTEQRLIVWRESPSRTPVKVVDAGHGETIQRDRGSLFGQLRFKTDVGPVYVSKTANCACGSTLKALSPPVPW